MDWRACGLASMTGIGSLGMLVVPRDVSSRAVSILRVMSCNVFSSFFGFHSMCSSKRDKSGSSNWRTYFARVTFACCSCSVDLPIDRILFSVSPSWRSKSALRSQHAGIFRWHSDLPGAFIQLSPSMHAAISSRFFFSSALLFDVPVLIGPKAHAQLRDLLLHFAKSDLCGTVATLRLQVILTWIGCNC